MKLLTSVILVGVGHLSKILVLSARPYHDVDGMTTLCTRKGFYTKPSAPASPTKPSTPLSLSQRLDQLESLGGGVSEESNDSVMRLEDDVATMAGQSEECEEERGVVQDENSSNAVSEMDFMQGDDLCVAVISMPPTDTDLPEVITTTPSKTPSSSTDIGNSVAVSVVESFVVVDPAAGVPLVGAAQSLTDETVNASS